MSRHDGGRLIAVERRVRGDELAADAAAGATTITLDDAESIDAPATGQTLQARLCKADGSVSELVAYKAVDDSTDQVTLVSGLQAAWSAGDRFELHPPEVSYVALIREDDEDEDVLTARVPHYVTPLLEAAIRDEMSRESVRVTQVAPGAWEVSDILGVPFVISLDHTLIVGSNGFELRGDGHLTLGSHDGDPPSAPSAGASNLAPGASKPGLAAGTYYYQVSALNAHGESGVAAEVSATLAEGQVARVLWSGVSGADKYRVWGRGPGDAGKRLMAEVTRTSTSWDDTGAITGSESPTWTRGGHMMWRKDVGKLRWYNSDRTRWESPVVANDATEALVNDSQSTTASAYGDHLQTNGPEVWVKAPLSGRLIVTATGRMRSSVNGSISAMSYQVLHVIADGSDTQGSEGEKLAASDNTAASNNGNQFACVSRTNRVAGLTPGNWYRIRARYRSNGTDQATFVDRQIVVVPL